MTMVCPHCGKKIDHARTTRSDGRKGYEIPSQTICDTLQVVHTIPAAAEKLDCSTSYIYKVLKRDNITPSSVAIRKKQTFNHLRRIKEHRRVR